MRWIGWATMAAVLALGCGGNTDRNKADSGGALDGSGGNDAGSSGGSDAGGSGATANAVSSDAGGNGGSSGNGGNGATGGGGSGATGGSDDGRGGTDGNEPVGGTPAPDDFPEYAKGPYGYCSPELSGAPRMYCPEDSASGASKGDGSCLEWCSCTVSCRTTADCPQPETGTSLPVCRGECRLSCVSTTCPDGMRCVETQSGVAECVWAHEGEENLSCWLYDHPDYCEQFTTKEACQERITTDPLQPGAGCIWMVERVHSTASTSCEPAAVTESCVPGVRQDCDAEGLSCPDSESWVHFRDVGAGTATLMITDRCFAPGGLFAGVSGEPCSFGEPTALPLLCDCACGL